MNQAQSSGWIPASMDLARTNTDSRPLWSDQHDRADQPTVLLVEDEAFVRDVASAVLHSAGYRVLTARTAAEAARTYKRYGSEVKLVLTDVVLPGQTGPSLVSTLRREEPELRVLYVTGYAEQMGIRLTKNEDFLAKPFSTDVLLQRVRQALEPGIPATRKDRVTHTCDVA